MKVHAGALLIWWAASFSFIQGILGLRAWFRFKASPPWERVSLYVTFLQAFFALSAFGWLCILHGTLDFSYITVFTHTHTHLPLIYRLGAVWSSSEGSMLLWCTVLSLWGATYAYISSRHSPAPTLALLGLLNLSFWGLLICFFDPFVLLDHQPAQGLGLNPLLHDPSLMIHPLLLYGGYGGLSIPFALTLQQVLSPHAVAEKEIISWTRAAWIFLTLGLLTGSIWAYYELGWGSYWFWDPVENVALLPWLWATGVMHLGKQPMARRSLFLLSLLAFLFVLWGTALTRSGLFLSVHSFASLPARILPLLTVVAFWSVLSLGLWGHSLKSPFHNFWAKPTFERTLRWIPILFLGVTAFIVAWGTFLPLTSITPFYVEASFYNTTLFILLLGPFILMPVIPFWNKLPTLLPSLLMTVALFWGILAFVTVLCLKALLCLFLSLWMGIGSLPLLRFPRHLPQAITHIGVALCLCGISCSSFWKTEIESPLQIGQSLSLGENTLKFEKVTLTKGDLFDREQGVLRLNNGKIILRPERRLYHPQEAITTETALHTTPFRDIYVVLGDFVGHGTWLIRATLHPGLWGIWGGGLLMALGGLLAFFRLKKKSKP